jgi:hypothetical protein
VSGHSAMGVGWSSSVGRLLAGVGIGVLVRQVPSGLVDEVLEVTGGAQRRFRALPSRLGVYFVLALCLFSDSSYGTVIATMVSGRQDRLEAAGWRVAFSTARDQATPSAGGRSVRAVVPAPVGILAVSQHARVARARACNWPQ